MLNADEKREYCKKRGYSALYAEYWCSHVGCEARCSAPSEPPHHLRTRGAGGPDDEWNLLALCALHHRLYHNVGGHRFSEMFSHLAKKISESRHHPLDKRTVL